jgi:hypothetical protein
MYRIALGNAITSVGNVQAGKVYAASFVGTSGSKKRQAAAVLFQLTFTLISIGLL